MANEKVKTSVKKEVETRRNELQKLSSDIHATPELAFHEFEAARQLTEYLKNNGFTIEKGICGLDTAFKAAYGRGKPAIAVLAEYDALPKIGHACGHNIIATSAVGAAVAAKLAVDQFGGSVLVIGTPAEEIYAGKALMVARGAFAGLDAAMIVHPSTHNTVTIHPLAAQELEIEFFGKAAHAAANPEDGINALEALIQSFNAINSLRQHVRDKVRIHGIITDGGEAANIVPAHTAASFLVRAEDDSYLERVKDKVLDCFTGAAVATGARLDYKWMEAYYASMTNNMTMARLFRQNLESLGRKVRLANPAAGFGSTDVGNVSQVVPTIHPSIAIAPREVLVHSPEFAKVAASRSGLQGLIDAAKAMAMTISDLLSDPEVMKRVKREFEQSK